MLAAALLRSELTCLATGYLHYSDMLFNAESFILIFLPLTVIIYYALSGQQCLRLLFLILLSLGYYGFFSPGCTVLLIGSAVGNWLIAREFIRRKDPLLPIMGVGLNLFLLGFFKYADFCAAIVFGILGKPFDSFQIFLPLGISFFSFQQISYRIDLKRGNAPFYSLLDYLLFMTFYPKLIAGPIVRHDEIIDQFVLPPKRREMWENLSRGTVLFLIGLFKKVVIADKIAELVDPLFVKAAAESLTFGEGWMAAYTYTLQIYFDFSGYSDMAIGLALLYGFKIPINFNVSYLAISVRDFWRRWHITLSRFLRDYLYIPLGGNQCSGTRQAVNVIVTMLLGGLWHGANWTFVVWGGLHGAGLAVNSAWNRSRLPMPKQLGWLLTLLFVMSAWILFRAENFTTAAGIWLSMLGRNGLTGTPVDDGLFLVVSGLLAVIGPTSDRFALSVFRPRPWAAVVLAGFLVFLILRIGGGLHTDFIYFQF